MSGKSKPEQDSKGRFVTGNSGGGRSKGSRNKLGEAFVDDIYADWKENGEETIKTVREEKPDQYLKVVASILPKQMEVNINKFEELTDEQLREQLERVAKDLGALAAFGVTGDVDGDKETTRH